MSEETIPVKTRNVKEILESGAFLAGGLAAGFGATKAVAKIPIVQKHPMAGGALIIAAGAVGAAMAHKRGHDKVALASLAFIGVGLLQMVAHAVAPGPAGSTGSHPFLGDEEMNGIIPENLKAKIRGFLPSFGSIEDEEIFKQMNGSDYEDLRGGYADLTGEDDMGALDIPHEEINGIGNAGNMI